MRFSKDTRIRLLADLLLSAPTRLRGAFLKTHCRLAHLCSLTGGGN